MHGGAEMHAAELAVRLRERGHEVGALTFGIDGPDVVASVRAWPYRTDEYAEQSQARKLVFHALDVYRPATRRSVDAAIAGFAPDVVHTHAVAGFSSAVLSEPSRRGVGHVHTLHDYWLLCQRRSLTQRDGTVCERRCTGCAVVSRVRNAIVERHPPTIIHAVSQAIADAHEERLEWTRSRMRIVPNPTDAAPRTTVRTDGGPVTFGFLGRFTVEKGLRTLVRAFAAASVPGARLFVAGDGPQREEIEAELSPGVELIGWVDEQARAEFLRTIDCLVVPSEYPDPAPLVVNEARARCLPVIGARSGGIPELVSRRSEPLLFPAGDSAALAAQLERFARGPSAFVDEGIGDLMTWDRHLDLVEASYEDAARAVRR
jgi:glycosyltransferase involved in cell wall biosynthesis